MYSLRVIQQPERARLCSYKEENETSESPLAVMTRWELINPVDRRPVDPPPVVEMLLDSKQVFSCYAIHARLIIQNV